MSPKIAPTESIMQLKIMLENTSPPVWRRVLVRKETTFADLHSIIQIVMGWEDCHLHKFEAGDKTIQVLGEYSDEGAIDASTITLRDVMAEPPEWVRYIYDFGDSWTHRVTLENYVLAGKGVHYPICTKGKSSCFSEDSAGFDEEFPPVPFDIDDVNAELAGI